MNYYTIIPDSYVDGPGRRTVLFLQGCSLGCPGCQNKHLWPVHGGRTATPQQLARDLVSASTEAFTISGGEPFQQSELYVLLTELRHLRTDAHIIVYSGYTWAELHTQPEAVRCLPLIDVLVDGRFIQGRDHDLVQWRGSANQRPIDVPASVMAGHPVVLDWDTLTVTITDAGDLLMPIGLDFITGPVAQSRRCGETVQR